MLFDNPDVRAAFIDLHGTDKEGAKFKLGQRVVFKKTLEDGAHEWTGVVQAVNHVEKADYEYLIEGATVLAWQEELEAC